MTHTIGTPVSYFYDNSGEAAPQQLDALATFLDPYTTALLRELVALQSGLRCVEIGPGGGSIARWLADRVGPAGRVIAIDKDPSQIPPADLPNLHIVQHDLQTGLPTLDGPVQLVHARLCLVHLPTRRQLLAELIDKLAPGGWLVIGEFLAHPMRVLTTASDDDRDVYLRVMAAFTNLLTGRHGVDIDWGHQAQQMMSDAGLHNLATTGHIESWSGPRQNQLHLANLAQLAPRLVDAGCPQADIDAFIALMHDPTFSAPSWPFVIIRGQKPFPQTAPATPSSLA